MIVASFFCHMSRKDPASLGGTVGASPAEKPGGGFLVAAMLPPANILDPDMVQLGKRASELKEDSVD